MKFKKYQKLTLKVLYLHASSSINHLKFNDANEEISNQFNDVVEPYILSRC